MMMSERDATALQRYGVGLLERAVAFTLETLDAPPPFTARDLYRPTPCEGWDLGMLLQHMDDSLAALHEAVSTGTVQLFPHPGECPQDLVGAVQDGAVRLLEAWRDADRADRVITVAGCPIRAGVVAGTGAVELVVHAWDVAWARGGEAEIPAPLAERLLRLTPLLVPGHARSGLFAPPIAASPGSPPSDRLIAYLGRDPRMAHARTA
ncbi:TIGR03086 family metal-binding protein [Actinomadura sp. 9N407]|uniref:TIGR03086 family metal-binding protein n=1 Tax=Actinomadura sp. 9N407 TaxID=3375154 RepID=UPI00378A85DC